MRGELNIGKLYCVYIVFIYAVCIEYSKFLAFPSET